MKTYQSRLSISLYKVENKKEKIADFKTAISSTVRSLSNSEKIEVSFGNDASKSGTNSIRLPELSRINNKLNYNQIRAIADSKSLRHRFSDLKIFNSPKARFFLQSIIIIFFVHFANLEILETRNYYLDKFMQYKLYCII